MNEPEAGEEPAGELIPPTGAFDFIINSLHRNVSANERSCQIFNNFCYSVVSFETSFSGNMLRLPRRNRASASVTPAAKSCDKTPSLSGTCSYL